MRDLLLVAIFGAAGALARHGAGLAAARILGPGFPWATVFVNVLGSFALGVLVEAGSRTQWATPQVRLALGTGFLGAFTTFSTFSVETVRLAETQGATAALGNLGANGVVGLAAAAAGIAAVRWVVPA